MSFMELAGMTYHCQSCDAELSVMFVGEQRAIQISDLVCLMQEELNNKYSSQVPMFHVEDCICAECASNKYDESIHRISDAVNSVIGVLEGVLEAEQTNCYEAKKQLVTTIKAAIDELCASYDAATCDAGAIQMLLTDKNIRDVNRQKKLVKKYLSEHWDSYVKRIEDHCDASAVQKVLHEMELTTTRNREEFQSYINGISSNGDSILVLKRCAVDGIINLNPFLSAHTTVAALDPTTVSNDTAFYREKHVDIDKLTFNTESIDMYGMMSAVIQQSEYYKTVREGLLRELSNAFASK